MRQSTGYPETAHVRPIFSWYPVLVPALATSDCSADGEYAVLRTEAAVAIPEDVDPAAFAPLMCAGVTVFNSIRQLKVSPGSIVAIQGLGGLGHLGVQFANKMGYRTVALSSSASKEKFAKDLGAHEYIDGSKQDHAEGLQKLGGADLIVVTAPNPDIIGKLVFGLAPLGKLLILARKSTLILIIYLKVLLTSCKLLAKFL